MHKIHKNYFLDMSARSTLQEALCHIKTDWASKQQYSKSMLQSVITFENVM